MARLTAKVNVDGKFRIGRQYDCPTVTERALLIGVLSDSGSTEIMTIERAKYIFEEKDIFIVLLCGGGGFSAT